MTGNELLETVCQMGFVNTLSEGQTYFYRAANLSLSRICRSFPLRGYLTLHPHAGEEYDVAQEADDFIGFSASPILGEALAGKSADIGFLREGRDYVIDGSRILFRAAFDTVTVRYLRRARALTEDNMETPLDIDPAAESLLPLLTASYLWLDDRGELATHYLALYRTEAQELLRNLHRHGSLHYATNGWDNG